MIKFNTSTEQRSTSLYDLIDGLIRFTLPVALRNHNLIVNEVSPQLTIKSDKKSLTSVIGEILSTILNHSKSSYMRISAKRYHDVIVVHVRDFNILNSEQLPFELKHLQELTRKIGGYVGITSQRQYETTVAFSFPDVKHPGA